MSWGVGVGEQFIYFAWCSMYKSTWGKNPGANSNHVVYGGMGPLLSEGT